MTTYLDIYTAQFEAAHAAYGDASSGQPNMSPRFAHLLIQGWLKTADKTLNNGAGNWALMPLAGGQSQQAYPYVLSLVGLDSSIDDDASLVSSQDEIWSNVGALAGIISYIADVPNDVARAASYLADKAAQGAKDLEDGMSSWLSSLLGILNKVMLGAGIVGGLILLATILHRK